MIKFRLRRLLRNKEITQESLSIMTGIRPGTINAYYHCYAKRLNVSDLNKICEVLECNLSDLIEYVPKKQK